jgi:hypothetical protein
MRVPEASATRENHRDYTGYGAATGLLPKYGALTSDRDAVESKNTCRLIVRYPAINWLVSPSTYFVGTRRFSASNRSAF